MSYDLGLYKDKKAVVVKLFVEGGTYPVAGSVIAELNVTYNYGWFFFHLLDKKKGIRWLYGKQAKNTLKRLSKAVKELGTHTDRNYWLPTPGNAGYTLNILRNWAKQHPTATWQGD